MTKQIQNAPGRASPRTDRAATLVYRHTRHSSQGTSQSQTACVQYSQHPYSKRYSMWASVPHWALSRPRGYSKTNFIGLSRSPTKLASQPFAHFLYVRRRLWRPETRCCAGMGHNPPENLVTNRGAPRTTRLKWFHWSTFHLHRSKFVSLRQSRSPYSSSPETRDVDFGGELLCQWRCGAL